MAPHLRSASAGPPFPTTSNALIDHKIMTSANPTISLLTVRQVEILKLAARGNSAKEIAIEFAIAPRTVECHIERIRLILRARNQPHMVAIAMRRSII